MTADKIFQEIEKRMESLDSQKEQLMNEIYNARAYGDFKKENKLIKKRQKIALEKSKLLCMYSAYKNYK